MRRRNFLKTSLGAAGAALTYGSIPSQLLFAGVPPLPAGTSSASYDSLRNAFANPPIQNQNWTRWWWFGPQATEEGVTYELEQMKKQAWLALKSTGCARWSWKGISISFRIAGHRW